MLLTIDIGNTTVAVGGFQGPELRFVRRLPSDRNMDAAVCAARIRTLLAEEGAAPQDVEGAVLSSVVPSLTQVAVQAAEALTRRPVPVSYTHLDVYKRQGRSPSPAGAGKGSGKNRNS